MQQVVDSSRSASSTDGSALLKAARALQPVVRSFQAEGERERRIPQPLVDQLKAAGLYRLLLPRQMGGQQADLLTFLSIAECIAEGDGSVGWNLVNNAVLQLMTLSLPQPGVDEIFAAGPDTIIAGTAVPGGGSAVRVDGGYLVTGRWPFGSGCQESQWLVGNFAVVGEEGTMYRAVFRTTECTIIDTWDMTGMRATGSHDWAVADVFVPEHRTCHVPGKLLFNQWQHWPGTFYALPIHALIGPHHSVIATGIARAGIDSLTELAGAKVPRGRTGLLREREQVQEAVARAEAILTAGQTYRTSVVQELWDTVEAGRPTTLQQHARSRLAASFAVDCARQAMDLVYRAGGTTSTQRTHRLAHCWRDLQVVGQSAGIGPEWYPLVGRVLLGLDPGPRLV